MLKGGKMARREAHMNRQYRVVLMNPNGTLGSIRGPYVGIKTCKSEITRLKKYPYFGQWVIQWCDPEWQTFDE